MTHAAEIWAIINSISSGACFWYVCHAVSGTRFVWYQILAPVWTLFHSKPHTGMHMTEIMILHFLFNYLSLASLLVPHISILLLLQELVVDVAVVTSFRHADLSWAIAMTNLSFMPQFFFRDPVCFVVNRNKIKSQVKVPFINKKVSN